MGRSSRSSSSPPIRGSSAVNSIQSFSHDQPGRIRCSPGSSPRQNGTSATDVRGSPPGISSRPPTDVALFSSNKLFLIAGPCVLESDDLNRKVADHLAKLAHLVPGGIIFKASFDKANRSNADAARGPGIDKGLATLAKVHKATGLPLLTDVHLPEQCAQTADVVDVLQIPAFLCRQTDLLIAAGKTGKAVNVKKGQWMHPEGMKGAVEK